MSGLEYSRLLEQNEHPIVSRVFEVLPNFQMSNIGVGNEISSSGTVNANENGDGDNNISFPINGRELPLQASNGSICGNGGFKDEVVNLRDDIYSYKYHTELNYLILNYMIFEGYENGVLEFAKELGLWFIVDELTGDQKLDIEKNDDNSVFESLYQENCELVDTRFQVDEFFTVDEIENNIEDNYQRLMKGKNKNVSEYNDISNKLSIDKIKRLTFGLSSIKIRNKIKLLILSGQITEAIDLINENFPTLFEKNQFIYFKLLHLNLIEMIRSYFQKNHDSTVVNTDNDSNDGKEKDFLDSVLTFIKDKLSTVKILQNESFIKELELTMALLCFGNYFNMNPASNGNANNNNVKIPGKLKSLIDKKLRRDIYKLVNKSILINLNNEDLNNLTNDFKYNDYYSFKMYDNPKKYNFNIANDANNNENSGNNNTGDGHNNNNENNDNNEHSSSNLVNRYQDQEESIKSKNELIDKFNDINHIKLNSLIKLWIYSIHLNEEDSSYKFENYFANIFK